MTRLTKLLALSAAVFAFQTTANAYEHAHSTANNNLTGWDLRGGFDIGYGNDNVDHKVGRSQTGNSANGTLFSAEVKNAESWMLNPQMTASYNNGFWSELKGTFKFVSNGGESHTNFNPQTGVLTNRNTASLDGDTALGGSLALGYNVIPLMSREWAQWNVKPLIGGELHRQKYSTRDNTILNAGGTDNIGINTRYRGDWSAFFAGLSVGYDFNEQNNLTVRGRYSWADFNGNAGRVKLSSGNNTYGYGFAGAYTYKLLTDIDVVLGVDWSRFQADKTKNAFNGVTTVSGRTTWDSLSVTGGFRYRFW